VTSAFKSKKKSGRNERTAIFSIGAQLVLIVTLIVLVSLGSIIALVSMLVRQDLQLSAEDINFEENRRSAAEAEDTFNKIQSDTMILIKMINSSAANSGFSREMTDFFFERHNSIAAMVFVQQGRTEWILTNENFFLKNNIDSNNLKSFIDNHRTVLRRALLGETIVLNAAPYFSYHLLAMFFPGLSGGIMTLFFPESLNTSFTSGLNQSWMINGDGDILIHSDYSLIRGGVNVADKSVVRNIRESTHRNRQSIQDLDFGFTRIDSSNKDVFERVWESVKNGVTFVFVKTKNLVLPVIDKGIDAFCNLFFIDRQKPDKSAEEKPDAVSNFVAYNKLKLAGCIVITNIEYNKVFEGITATTRRNIYLTGAVLCFSVLLIWFFAKNISIPLKMLAVAARTIEGGEFEIQLPSKRRDEIGILTASFQKMCSALRIFGRFTNKEIAIKAMRGQIKPGGTPKHATIFFSDIRNFTAKSETFSNVYGLEAPDRIVHWLNRYFTHMIYCVERKGGTIDKFIGDAVMAHWGAAYTLGTPDKDALNCVYSALLMRTALHEMNKRRRKGDHGDPVINIGCGINSGLVTAGQLGSDMRMEYTVIGDPVNLASRIESLTKPLGVDILISENTWRLIYNKIITEEMPSVTVKGKEKPVRLFAVINYIGAKSGPGNINQLRQYLGIDAPDISKVDVNADEKKYKIGGKENQK